MFPIYGTQVVAVAIIESVITPAHSFMQPELTPLREQQLLWFLPPAPHLISLGNSGPQTPANCLMSLMLASYEQSGKQTVLRLASSQQAVTLYACDSSTLSS